MLQRIFRSILTFLRRVWGDQPVGWATLLPGLLLKRGQTSVSGGCGPWVGCWDNPCVGLQLCAPLRSPHLLGLPGSKVAVEHGGYGGAVPLHHH